MVQKPIRERDDRRENKNTGGGQRKNQDARKDGNNVILMGPPKNDTKFLGPTSESLSKKGKDFVAMKDVLLESGAAKAVSGDGHRGRFNLGKPFLLLSILFIVVLILGEVLNIFGPVDIHYIRFLPLLLILFAIAFFDVARTPRGKIVGVLITVLIFIGAVGALVKFGNTISIISTGVLIEEERTVPTFSRIVFDGVGDVTLTEGENTGVMVEGDEATVGDVVTDVRDETLFISYKSPFLKLFLSENSHIVVSLIAPQIESVVLTGRGTVSGDVGTTDALIVGLHGRGDITLSGIDAKTVTSQLSGKGTITLRGKTLRHLVYLTGEGNYEAEDLVSDETGVRLSGSGDVVVHSSKELNAVISGQGDIIYSGNPTITGDTVTGTGSLSPKK